MRFEDYIDKITMTTAAYPGALSGSREEVMYLALGLIDETMELEEKIDFAPSGTVVMPYMVESILDEMGDCVWYFGSLKRVFHDAYTLSHLTITFDNCDAALRQMRRTAGKIAGKAKKIFREGRDFSDGSELQAEILHYLSVYYAALQYLALRFGSNFESLCNRNGDKLLSRKDRGVLLGDGDNR